MKADALLTFFYIMIDTLDKMYQCILEDMRTPRCFWLFRILFLASLRLHIDYRIYQGRGTYSFRYWRGHAQMANSKLGK